ncbi:uncharacterized protein EDB91DRAFT_1078600 [Suillus paluster]|uniref:uncharacterized protein n=1 Tax=Suillus paluster TaxID=48578 RepID=UPI001B87FC10|nr:uncharacterized protein EDB91DRAFT_1078600 [Suillus paluster]KAG1750582.1 hypothetical protein EDB91DRAFT_1078600 [Suillus paluster]
MPCAQRRKQDHRDILILHSVLASTLAVSRREQGHLRELFTPDHQDLDDDKGNERLTHFLHGTAMGLHALSLMISVPGSHGPYIQWRKCNEFFDISLSWPDRDFRHEYRISRATFDRLVRILEQNPIFQSMGRKPQRPVHYQLACSLLCYGTRGGDSLQAAHKLGIGFGTVFLYCKRIVHALREIGMQVVTWGDEDRQNETTRRVMDRSGIPDCIGMLDGSLIWLTKMPDRNGLTFICRKKYPAINVQAVVDHEK